MTEHFSVEGYDKMLDALFQRFPSFQKVGAGAYKPGIGNMEFMDQLLGHPHINYKIIHVAGTNGKGSVSNMLTSVLASMGYNVGLYTSPHILDFRERIKIIDGTENGCTPLVTLIPKEDVWKYVNKWRDTFDHLDMSFFEITTSMALDWFSKMNVDYVVLETGLGGRLDSTNIVNPVLSIITNIGLDHCDLLGDTLPEIAFEKSGIIKPAVPVVVGESQKETDSVFERKVLYTNLPEPKFMGDRNEIMTLLTFADKVQPMLWDRNDEIVAGMDLRGDYQRKNLRTVLAALDVLGFKGVGEDSVMDALMSTASRVRFHGRWETVSKDPHIICDIGHNCHGLKYNFSQLRRMKEEHSCTELIIVYGSVADKDFESVIPLMPSDAHYVFTQAKGKRALSAESIMEKFQQAYPTADACAVPDVSTAVKEAMNLCRALSGADAHDSSRPLIYIGGSTYVVSEALGLIGQ